MPRLQTRDQYEQEIIIALMAAWQRFLAGGAFHSEVFAVDAANILRGVLEKVYNDAAIAMLLLMFAEGEDTALFQTIIPIQASTYAYQRSQVAARQIAGGIFTRAARRMAAGGELDDIFSPSDAENYAASEVTRAVSAGEREARQNTVFFRRRFPDEPITAEEFSNQTLVIGDNLIAIWRVQENSSGGPDEKVCPICLPLADLPAPYDPPAHIRCRCYLDYEFQ